MYSAVFSPESSLAQVKNEVRKVREKGEPIFWEGAVVCILHLWVVTNHTEVGWDGGEVSRGRANADTKKDSSSCRPVLEWTSMEVNSPQTEA